MSKSVLTISSAAKDKMSNSVATTISAAKDKMPKKSVLTIIACNTDSDIKKRALLHNFPFFAKISSTIIIINSSEYHSEELNDALRTVNIKSTSTKLLFMHIPNDRFLCHGKWIHVLQTLNKALIAQFDNFILTNDSIIITRELTELSNRIDKNTELVAMLDSYEIKYHYPDFLRCYNKIGLAKIIDFYVENKSKISTYQSVVETYEVGTTNLFPRYKVKIAFKQACKRKVNVHFCDSFTFYYLFKRQYPIIKIKKILHHVEMSGDHHPRQLLPANFSSSLYAELYPDLRHLKDDHDALVNHFLRHGIAERRPYTPFLHHMDVMVYLLAMIDEMVTIHKNDFHPRGATPCF